MRPGSVRCTDHPHRREAALESVLPARRTGSMVEIVESYRDFSPPAPIRPSVERMILAVPGRYLYGLGTVVLTNASGLPRRRRVKTRSRRRKVAIARCRGLYHRRWRGQAAWIEIFVDNCLHGLPPYFQRLTFFIESAVAEVFFHELGHHIHATVAPEYREPEAVAERYSRHLLRPYLRRRYWWLVVASSPVVVATMLWKGLSRHSSIRHAGGAA